MMLVCIFLFSNSRLSTVNSEQLTQPGSMTVQPGQTLTITFQVSYSISYFSSFYTAWIRQSTGKGNKKERKQVQHHSRLLQQHSVSDRTESAD